MLIYELLFVYNEDTEAYNTHQEISLLQVIDDHFTLDNDERNRFPI